MQPIEYDPSRSNTGVQVVPLFTVFQTPPDADATKYFEALFGSTANPMTRPEVNAGPNDRNLNPLKVGVDIGSRGRFSSSPCGLAASGFAASGEGLGVEVERDSGCDKAIDVNVRRMQTVSVTVRKLRGNIRDSPLKLFSVVRKYSEASKRDTIR
jgi:hypothetical protein